MGRLAQTLGLNGTDMDTETIKTAISAVSAIVAVVAATLAHRAKVQTRRDLFDSLRDTLIIEIAENDAQIRLLKLHILLAKSSLLRLHPNLFRDSEPEVAKKHLSNLSDLENFRDILEDREYSARDVDSTGYSESNLSRIRRWIRIERAIGKHLMPDGISLLIREAEKYAEEASKV